MEHDRISAEFSARTAQLNEESEKLLGALRQRLKADLEAMGKVHMRGAVIMLHAALEDALKLALAETFHARGTPAKKLLGLEDSAGEMSYANQCLLAHCLGLVGKGTLSDLGILGRIRNRFAHTNRELTFGDQEIANRCRELKTPDRLGREAWAMELLKIKDLWPPTQPRPRRWRASTVLIIEALGQEARHKNQSPLSGPQVLL